MLFIYTVLTAVVFCFCLILAGVAYAEDDEKASACLVVCAFMAWSWPVVVPLAIVFGLINLTFFTIEQLTKLKRPGWWPVQP